MTSFPNFGVRLLPTSWLRDTVTGIAMTKSNATGTGGGGLNFQNLKRKGSAKSGRTKHSDYYAGPSSLHGSKSLLALEYDENAADVLAQLNDDCAYLISILCLHNKHCRLTLLISRNTIQP